jgi:hypothetical protein
MPASERERLVEALAKAQDEFEMASPAYEWPWRVIRDQAERALTEYDRTHKETTNA